MERDAIRIHPQDNVAVALRPLAEGEAVSVDGQAVRIQEEIPFGHKVALTDLADGAMVVKYGAQIGHTTQAVPSGAWLHSHNLKTNLEGLLDYQYAPAAPRQPEPGNGADTFLGYCRPDGRVGTRNELWIIPTVSCVNRTVSRMAEEARRQGIQAGDGIFAFPHNAGCSQLGDDFETTQKLLRNLVKHPNAGGVLLVSLGCENNDLDHFLPVLGDYDRRRIRTLVTQDMEGDEIEAGLSLMREIAAVMAEDRREECPASRLVLGFKCGGSDAFSGLTANPSAGYAADMLVKGGATVLFSEVTEVRDGVPMLAARCVSAEVRDKLAAEMKWYDDYLDAGGVDRDANPTPGNKKGGLANIVEKAMGSIAKSGTAPIEEVLSPAEKPHKHGLIYAATPASDIVCGPCQLASGIGLQVFMTGRGTPYGLAAAPVIKVCSRNEMKEHWFDLIDVNAGPIATGEKTIADVGAELFHLILDVASGVKKPYSDQYGFHNDLCIFNPAPIT